MDFLNKGSAPAYRPVATQDPDHDYTLEQLTPPSSSVMPSDTSSLPEYEPTPATSYTPSHTHSHSNDARDEFPPIAEHGSAADPESLMFKPHAHCAVCREDQRAKSDRRAR
ncbi:hypothetical protein MMC09_001880, partial [Bachmanniomyces sp. S44760]|nr:hypothetical protein [Bachmanniomyces sp. S44760]